MIYRFARPDDADLLAHFNRQLIRDEGSRNPMTPDELEARMRGWLESGEFDLVLFEDDGAPVGYAAFRDEGKEGIYLRQFFVLATHRRRGVGRAAVTWLIANPWCGAPRVRVEALNGNADAIAFWQSVGFAPAAVTLERDILPPETPGA
jgi:GNAT superfamily N-acetyltransferase